MRLKPYLQLVRLPNLFTAAADPLAGWIVATGGLRDPGSWVPLVAASVLIYAAGIVLNDVFDVEIDRAERPNRPLPAGRVPLRPAAWAGGLALAAGPLVAGLSGSLASALVAAALALCVLAYDSGLKRTVLGPEAMGLCRSLNFLLGFSQTTRLGGPWAWIIAGAFGLFVVGVTWISRSEVATGRRAGFLAGATLQGLALAALADAAIVTSRAINFTGRLPGWGLAVLGMVAWTVGRADARAIRHATPALAQRAVKTGVLALVWLDVAIVAATRGPGPALPVAALWVPAFLLARWLYAT